MYWFNASKFFTYSQFLYIDENKPKQYISKVSMGLLKWYLVNVGRKMEIILFA